MYAERIEKNPYLPETDPNNVSLYDVVDRIVAGSTSDLQAAEAIHAVVNDILFFPRPEDYRKLGLDQALSLEQLVDRQVANCYGFTLLTSECFSHAGIDHKIAFSNEHAFVVKPDIQGGLHMFDMPSSRLNGDISPAILASSYVGANRQVLETTPASLTASKGVKYGRHPWLGVKDMTSFGIRDGKKLLISLFEPADGRQSVELYARFCENMGQQDHLKAAEYVWAMAADGLYPNIDARPRDKMLRAMVRGLVSDGRSDVAVEITNVHFGALEAATGDARFFARHGDMLRMIASNTKSLDLAYMADDCYRQADDVSHHSTTSWLNGRMRKLSQLVSEVEGEA
jgi:hypothetical protein